MNHGNSGLAHGTSGSSQLTLDNGDMAVSYTHLDVYKRQGLFPIRTINEIFRTIPRLASTFSKTALSPSLFVG